MSSSCPVALSAEGGGGRGRRSTAGQGGAAATTADSAEGGGETNGTGIGAVETRLRQKADHQAQGERTSSYMYIP